MIDLIWDCYFERGVSGALDDHDMNESGRGNIKGI